MNLICIFYLGVLNDHNLDLTSVLFWSTACWFQVKPDEERNVVNCSVYWTLLWSKHHSCMFQMSDWQKTVVNFRPEASLALKLFCLYTEFNWSVWLEMGIFLFDCLESHRSLKSCLIVVWCIIRFVLKNITILYFL